MIVQDFKQWIKHTLDDDEYLDTYELYLCVRDRIDNIRFRFSKRDVTKGEQIFIKAVFHDDTLQLVSEEQVQYMLDYLQKEYMQDMDVEAFYSFHYAMEKENVD